MSTEYHSETKLPGIAIIADLSERNKIVLETNVANIVDILKPLSRKLLILAGSFPSYNEPNIRGIIVRKKGWKEGKLTPAKVFGHPLADLSLAVNLLKFARHIDVVLYHINAKGYVLSMAMARLLRKRVVTLSFTSIRKSAKILRLGETSYVPSSFHFQAMKTLEAISFWLSHRIWVESENIIAFGDLDKYRTKISICGAFYIDTNLFHIAKEPSKRKNLVGYIGRLSEDKGILHFIEAIPKIQAQREDAEFLVGGGGPLLDGIEQWKSEHPEIKVRLTGWIPHEKIPEYLNELKLLVLPSYSEGLPDIVMEAMSCGVVVVATPVGGVPDLIMDGDTGFILEDNSPECIARNIIRALEHPGLDEIATKARNFIEQEYSYEIMVGKYRQALDEVVG